MKEAVVAPGPTVKIIDSPIPEPNDDQVRIKIVVSGTNPKDWKLPTHYMPDLVINQGDDIAGIVDKVGANVTEFKVGDRVAAFHEMIKPHGSYAEYGIAWSHTTFPIPETISFEEAATIPLAAMTSAVALYVRLGFPSPVPVAEAPHESLPQPLDSTPLIVYGAGSAVGAFAIQLAVRSGIHPLICVAGKSAGFVEKLLDPSKGDVLIDYRAGDEVVVEGLQKALAGREALYALDAVSEKGSYANIAKVLSKTGGAKLTLVLKDAFDIAVKEYPEFDVSWTMVGAVHIDQKEFGRALYREFSRGLSEGWFEPHPHEVVPGGLEGLQVALDNLKNGKASAIKYVVRIAETKGVGVGTRFV
ncbi:alcohol dehydrogenase-like protein [Podospora didyma]|uniref:Alcohol dehydrogenase-like protein n=1 Tax=Podospora didyma TaxID=330526 RepID=A0AAE0U6F5_9PEZI|nr:alcohol dehydrogenase-like protein [Podospora didyma]